VAKLAVEILTLFPRMCAGYLGESILGKAQESGLLSVRVQDIREHAEGRHRVCDDAPYGGGAGMVMKPEPLTLAIEAARARLPGALAVLMSPRGAPLDQALARRLAGQGRLVLVCGRYEGVDERVREHLVDEELSIGDYVLTGGELPALVLIDAVVRLLPGTIQEASHQGDSFAAGLLEHPQYTRPERFGDLDVPPVLLGGNHGEVDRWRRREALRRTLDRRPDLLDAAPLTDADRETLEELRSDEG
jgi:tRNA (guanine37-N1)-methyltransferase